MTLTVPPRASHPIEGGNENDYIYPSDPINRFDLDGNLGWSNIHRWAKKHAKGLRQAMSVASFGGFVACTVVSAGACAVIGVATAVGTTAARTAIKGHLTRGILASGLADVALSVGGYKYGKWAEGLGARARYATRSRWVGRVFTGGANAWGGFLSAAYSNQIAKAAHSE